MSEKKTGGPAFCTLAHDGMTLRDYFAAKAMAAMIGKDGFYGGADEGAPTHEDGWDFDECAEAAYELASAMLKARDE